MRNFKKASIIALTAALTLAACKEEEEKTNNTVTTTQDGSGLVTLTDVPLVRNGVEFSADIRGGCLDYSLKIRDNMPCEDFLTQLLQDNALNHKFFTAAKLSTDYDFIDSGLTGNVLPSQKAQREKDIQSRLDNVEGAVERNLEWGHTFYVIDRVHIDGDRAAGVAAAAAPLTPQQ